MLFSEWLQQQMNSRRLTGAELAERAGISRASAYFYLDGSRIPGPAALGKLYAALGVDPTSVPCVTPRLVGRAAHKS